MTASPQRAFGAELAVATEAAESAAELLLGWFDKGVEAEEKADRDLVSAADRESEALVRRIIADAFGDDLVVGEEGRPVSEAEAAGRRRWYVDPLDGTTNFLKGRRWWGVSIGFCDVDDRVAAGVIVIPCAGETYAAARGAGATRDGRPLRVADTAEVRSGLFTSGFHGEDGVANLPAWSRVMGESLSVRATGAQAPDLCAVAAGVSDGAWAVGTGPWDIAAGSLLVTEAGGVVTDLDGTPVRAPHTRGVVAAAPGVHARLLELVDLADLVAAGEG